MEGRGSRVQIVCSERQRQRVRRLQSPIWSLDEEGRQADRHEPEAAWMQKKAEDQEASCRCSISTQHQQHKTRGENERLRGRTMPISRSLKS